MDVRLREQVPVDPQLCGLGTHEAEGDARAFLHHVAELAGESELALALHPCRLDEQDVSADGCHRESRRDAGDFNRF